MCIFCDSFFTRALFFKFGEIQCTFLYSIAGHCNLRDIYFIVIV
jgi:hypothetical protein